MSTPHTPGLDQGPQTPGLDSNPTPTPLGFVNDINGMMAFVRTVQDGKEAARNADRATPRIQPKVETTFTASPQTRIKGVAPAGRRAKQAAAASSGDAASGASFCELFERPAASGNWFIRGGAVIAGNKNFNVADLAIPSTNGDHLVQITVNVEAYRDDDHTYFLSGIKTSSSSALSMTALLAANYADNADPAVLDGLGVIHLPVGSLRVVAGVPFFNPTGCGAFRVGQCGGSLNYAGR